MVKSHVSLIRRIFARAEPSFDATFVIDLVSPEATIEVSSPEREGRLFVFFVTSGGKNAYYGDILLRPSLHGTIAAEVTGVRLARSRPLFGVLGPQLGYRPDDSPAVIPFLFHGVPSTGLALIFRLHPTFRGTPWEAEFPCTQPETLRVVVCPLRR